MTFAPLTDLDVQLAAHLSRREWHDITDRHKPDPDSIQCLATAYEGRRNGETVWMFSRYEDDGDRFALVCRMRGESKRVDIPQDALQWLWEEVSA